MTTLDDYALFVGWFGELDKPRHEALLASPTRAAAIDDEPFVDVAVISRAEFDAGVAAARARGLAFAADRPTMELNAYAVVVEDGGDVSHASLGFDELTAAHIEAIAAALQPANRAPLDEVSEQVRALVGS
jgi:DNA-binding IclR family transcriptional regulator